MSMVLAYTRHEFAAQEECETLGLESFVPRRVDMIRQGKRRRPDPVISPAWPRYIFVDVTPDQWHWLKSSKHVHSVAWVPEREAQAIRKQARAIERDFTARMDQIEAGDRVAEYEPGQVLDIVSGQFAGQIVTFIGMIERAEEMFPTIEAEMVAMGRVVKMRLDPLDVRKAG
jgi:transcription antitermination factor NusG